MYDSIIKPPVIPRNFQAEHPFARPMARPTARPIIRRKRRNDRRYIPISERNVLPYWPKKIVEPTNAVGDLLYNTANNELLYDSATGQLFYQTVDGQCTCCGSGSGSCSCNCRACTWTATFSGFTGTNTCVVEAGGFLAYKASGSLNGVSVTLPIIGGCAFAAQVSSPLTITVYDGSADCSNPANICTVAATISITVEEISGVLYFSWSIIATSGRGCTESPQQAGKTTSGNCATTVLTGTDQLADIVSSGTVTFTKTGTCCPKCPDCGDIPNILCTFTGCGGTGVCDGDSGAYVGTLDGTSVCASGGSGTLGSAPPPPCGVRVCWDAALGQVGCPDGVTPDPYDAAAAWADLQIVRSAGHWQINLRVGMIGCNADTGGEVHWLVNFLVAASDCTSTITVTVPPFISPFDGTTTLVNGGTLTLAPGAC